MGQPHDLTARRMDSLAIHLVNAVAITDRYRIADLLDPLDVGELHALAVVLADRVAPTITDADRLSEAINLAAYRFGTTRHDVLSDSRRREDLDARAVVCYVGRLLDMTHSGIGRQISRDHSTVMHAVGRVGESRRLRTCAEQIAARLGWTRQEESA